MSFFHIRQALLRALSPTFVAPRHTPIASTVPLNKGATTWVRQPFGHRVTCESGSLWLSFDGEPRDIVLEPGETHRCTQRSALSIHALAASVARVA
jgi:hypothetical protein